MRLRIFLLYLLILPMQKIGSTRSLTSCRDDDISLRSFMAYGTLVAFGLDSNSNTQLNNESISDNLCWLIRYWSFMSPYRTFSGSGSCEALQSPRMAGLTLCECCLGREHLKQRLSLFLEQDLTFFFVRILGHSML